MSRRFNERGVMDSADLCRNIDGEKWISMAMDFDAAVADHLRKKGIRCRKIMNEIFVREVDGLRALDVSQGAPHA